MQSIEQKYSKNNRILDMILQLMEGRIINKQFACDAYKVNERTIRRDIETIRCYYAEKMTITGEYQDIVYQPDKKGYVLVGRRKYNKILSNSEILVISKILLGSRVLAKNELFVILDKIIDRCPSENCKEQVYELIRNEELNYSSLHYDRPLVDFIWQLGKAITNQNKLKIKYRKMDGNTFEKTVEPVAILFSGDGFYLLASADEEAIMGLREAENVKLSPVAYKIDRIDECQILFEHFKTLYKDKSREDQFHKHVQLMNSDSLRKVQFEYKGTSIESVLDCLPTAVIDKEENGVYTVSAEVFGNGFDMWMESQGSNLNKS